MKNLVSSSMNFYHDFLIKILNDSKLRLAFD